MKNIVKCNLVRIFSYHTFITCNFYNFYLYIIIDICSQHNASRCVKVHLLHEVVKKHNGEETNEEENSLI